MSKFTDSVKKAGEGKFWIQKAIQHKGSLTRQAKKAGESPMAFARSHQKAKGTTGKRSRLAMTLQGFNKGG